MDAITQAFESVIPSERTRVSLKIMDGSIRALAPIHPGALVVYVGELEFHTDIIGDSLESSFHLLAPAASVLLLDDVPAAEVKAPTATLGIAHWKVCPVVD